MKSRTKNILQTAINNMDREIPVLSAAGFVLTVNKTLNVTLYKILTDSDGLQWKVTDFVKDTSITVEPFGHGALTFDASSIFAPLPIFLHGTPLSTNDEYLVIDNKTREKTPFVWFLAPYTENKQGRLSSIDYTCSVRLFLMDEASNPKWLNEDHDKYAVDPMFELADMIYKSLDALYQVNTIESYSVKDRARFGVEVANKGNTRRIIDEDLSGAEMVVEFSLQKENC